MFPAPLRAAEPMRLHLLIPTHTQRHLRSCVAAIACQRRPPDSVVVTCDVADESIGALLEGVWPEVVRSLRSEGKRPPLLLHVSRTHQGEARLNQVRNNGLRALDQRAALLPADLVVVLDGDTVLAPNALERHAEEARRGADVIIAFRINLDREATEAIRPERLLLGNAPEPEALATNGELALLEQRQRRYRRHLTARRWLLPLLPKPHKPKILGGHHAVAAGLLRAANGYDEEYTGYGFDDDDLARRIYRLKPDARVSVAVRDILACHLWHPSRAPTRATEAPGMVRFARRDLPPRPAHGWSTPRDQPPPVVREISVEE